MASKRLISYVHRMIADVEREYVPGVPRDSIVPFALVRDAMQMRWFNQMFAKVPVIMHGTTRVYYKPLHNDCVYVQEFPEDGKYTRSSIEFKNKEKLKALLLELLEPPHNFCI